MTDNAADSAEERVRIRTAQLSDLDWILTAEVELFPGPWQRSTYEGQFLYERAVFLIAEAAGEPAGFALAWVAADELHLLKIAVSARHQRRGIGARLLLALEAECARRGAEASYLEVRQSNESAQRFYAHRGYQAIGIRRRYYSDSGEDAVVMRKMLTDAPVTDR